MKASSVVFILAAWVALTGWSGAKTQEPRDRRGVQPAGTAAVSGVLVVDDDQRQPVRRAVVSLSGSELPLARAIVTDSDGRFAFGGLPAGRYTLKASKGGYLTATLGAKRSGRGGVLVLAAGERMTDMVFRIPRAATITGAVTGPNGDPVPGLQVSAISVHAPELQPYSPTSTGFLTDDRGVYRIFGLAPGDYYVVASPPRQMATGAGNAVARSAAEIDAIFRQLRDMTHGTAAGAPAPRSPGRPAVPDAEKPPTYGYAPIFYPGTPNGAEAAIVSVAAGQERSGVDVIVERVRTAEIDGVVNNAHGPLPRVILSLAPRGPQLRGIYGGSPVLTQPVGPDGRFRYSGVAPGQYTIYVRASGVPPSSSSGRMGGGVSAPGDASAQTLWAAADVNVDGEHLTVSLDLQPALRVTGRIRFDGTSQAPEPLSAVRIGLAREGSMGMAAMNNTNIGTPPAAPASVRADGTFEFGGILPGTYRLSATVPMAKGWWARSAIVGGRDLLDVPLVIERDVTNVALTFSDQEGELFGQITGAGGTPAYETALIVFPADPALWRKGARRVQTATAASDGRFSIRGLPGGEYLLALLPDVEQHQLHDRAFLDQLARASVKVTLAEGERKRQDLQLR